MANPEFKIQVAIVKYLRAVMPRAIVQHSVNEVNTRGKAGMAQVMRQRAAGVFKGFPDLVVLAPNQTFLLEVKSKTGRTTDAQNQAHEMLRGIGYPVAVVKSVDDVRDFLIAECIPHNEVHYV